MKIDSYRKLQKRLDLYSLGFSSTSSAVEIKNFKKTFSAEDAGIFLDLTPRLETPETISGRNVLPVKETKNKLSDMSKRMDRELAELMKQYGMEAFGLSFLQYAGSFLRTIPVEQSLDVEHQVASYNDALKILKSKKTIVATECICRKKQVLLDNGCEKIINACFIFDSMAEYYLEHNLGTQITVDEAMAISKEAQKQGLVIQPATSQNPAGMCNCCGDCSGGIQAINLHPKPAEIVCTNHYASLNSSACCGFKTCISRCQTFALKMDDNGVADLNFDRCIGCGLCITACTLEALKLLPKSGVSQYKLPVDSIDQKVSLAKIRLLIEDFHMSMGVVYRNI